MCQAGSSACSATQCRLTSTSPMLIVPPAALEPGERILGFGNERAIADVQKLGRIAVSQLTAKPAGPLVGRLLSVRSWKEIMESCLHTSRTF